VSRYRKGKTNVYFTEARDSERQWHLLGRMQLCTSLQTYNHASTPPLSYLQAGCPFCCPTNSVKALKAAREIINNCKNNAVRIAAVSPRQGCPWSDSVAVGCCYCEGRHRLCVYVDAVDGQVAERQRQGCSYSDSVAVIVRVEVVCLCRRCRWTSRRAAEAGLSMVRLCGCEGRGCLSM